MTSIDRDDDQPMNDRWHRFCVGSYPIDGGEELSVCARRDDGRTADADAELEDYPRWTPDGQSIVFSMAVRRTRVAVSVIPVLPPARPK